MSGGTERLKVSLAERSYDILIGPGLLATVGRRLRPLLDEPRVRVVTDDNVSARYLAPVEASLAAAGIECRSTVLPAGERTKDFAHLERLIGWLLDSGVERGTTLLALGGGMVGDLTGLAAAITLRGLDYVQVPTTLLAQVDSSVGGKTGINTVQGKNLIGAFHQPRLVLADIDTLDTLPPRELRAGYAEVVKYGLINDARFFGWLEADGSGLLAGDRASRIHAVLVSCRAKAEIVAADEREGGRRALLNLGHTFGHALEAEAGYGDRLLHGEAVAIGLCLAFELSVRLGLCPSDHCERVVRHLASQGLPTSVAGCACESWSVDSLMRHMAKDKKVARRRLAFVLARGIGDAFVSRDVDECHVRRLWEESLAGRVPSRSGDGDLCKE